METLPSFSLPRRKRVSDVFSIDVTFSRPIISGSSKLGGGGESRAHRERLNIWNWEHFPPRGEISNILFNGLIIYFFFSYFPLEFTSIGGSLETFGLTACGKKTFV